MAKLGKHVTAPAPRAPWYESTVGSKPMSAERAAVAAEQVDYPNWPYDDRQRKLPLSVLLLLKEFHEALHDCGLVTRIQYREPDGDSWRYGNMADRDDHRWLTLRVWGGKRATVEYSPAEYTDRSHRVTVTVHPSGNVSWWHSATAQGEQYGRMLKLGSGNSAKSIVTHFKGVAPKGEL